MTRTLWSSMVLVCVSLAPQRAAAFEYLSSFCFSVSPFISHWQSKSLTPVCSSTTLPSGRTYLDPRHGAYARAFRATNDYAWVFARGHTVYFNVDAHACFLPDEASGTTSSDALHDPNYVGTNSDLTFGMPSFDFQPGADPTDIFYGRVVSTVANSTTAGASLTCDVFNDADHSRFDVLVTTRHPQANPPNTWSNVESAGTTIFHEWGHTMGLAHSDSFVALMNTSPIDRVSLAGRRVLFRDTADAVVVSKADGDMSQGLYAKGVGTAFGHNPDYGLSPVSRTFRRDSEGRLIPTTNVRTLELPIPKTGPVTFDSLAFTVLNHSKWRQGTVEFFAVEDTTNTDVVLNTPAQWFSLNFFPLPSWTTLLPEQAPLYFGTDRPGNVFFELVVPIRPAGLEALRSQMIPGRRYRVVMQISPPAGFIDADNTDNLVSSGISLRLAP